MKPHTFEELMQFSPDQLHSLSDRVWEAIKMKRDEAGFAKSFELKIGDIVEWDSGRRNRGLMVGKLVAKKIKNATVDCGIYGRWNVPMGILKKTDKKVHGLKEAGENLPGPKISFPFDKSGELAKALGEAGSISPSLGWNPTGKVSFNEGDAVEFTHPKKGVMQGKIVRMKRKKAIVNTGGPRNWDVPFNMLRKANNCGLHKIEDLKKDEPDHDCWDHAGPYQSDGELGHGFECKKCGKFLQAG